MHRTTTLVLAASVLMAACSAERDVAPRASKGMPPSPSGSGGAPGISIANATGTEVEIEVLDPRKVSMDERVLFGELVVPIPRALLSDEHREIIRAGESRALLGTITMNTRTRDERPAVVVGLPGGPLLLAVGTGRVVVRDRFDGERVIEAEDPKTVTLIATTPGVAECTTTSMDPAYDLTGIAGYGPAAPVTAVSRDGDGCRTFTVQEETRKSVVRVCIPDAAYPFTDDDVLTFGLDNSSFDLGSTWMFANARGHEMRLVHATFRDGMADEIETLSLVGRYDTTCARIDAECGSVDVPTTLTYSFDGSSPRPVTLGAPIVDPADPQRSYAVLSARARPVANQDCISSRTATTDTWRVHAWLALIERPAP